MKLSLSVLLVALALCCYGADAVVCPSLATVMTDYFMMNAVPYAVEIATYNAPLQDTNAVMTVKTCTDALSEMDRAGIMATLANLLAQCNGA